MASQPRRRRRGGSPSLTLGSRIMTWSTRDSPACAALATSVAAARARTRAREIFASACRNARSPRVSDREAGAIFGRSCAGRSADAANSVFDVNAALKSCSRGNSALFSSKTGLLSSCSSKYEHASSRQLVPVFEATTRLLKQTSFGNGLNRSSRGDERASGMSIASADRFCFRSPFSMSLPFSKRQAAIGSAARVICSSFERSVATLEALRNVANWHAVSDSAGEAGKMEVVLTSLQISDSETAATGMGWEG
ncbi:hypothetical protein DFJ73DRAFT_812192 [Zopfochytrium polystomum]|nr:hypothetical protein DFJ73DRAFT_812192 [Zopfochytrium polystomum]